MEEEYLFRNEGGFVLVVAMFVLMLLTVMGTAAIMISNNEMKIAGNDKYDKRTFFAAEAGLGHIRGRLQKEFDLRSQMKIAAGQNPDWDFALKGVKKGINPAANDNLENKTKWLEEEPLGDGARLQCSYSVVIWNNPDDLGGITDDTDQKIYVQSTASGSRGTQSGVWIALIGQDYGEAISGYFAQACGGAGKNNNSRDVRAIKDFTIR